MALGLDKMYSALEMWVLPSFVMIVPQCRLTLNNFRVEVKIVSSAFKWEISIILAP